MEYYEDEKSISKRKFFRPSAIIIIVIIATSLSFGGYFYYKYTKLIKNPNAEAKKEAEDLLSKVAKIYLIPTGEEPTVATVSDPNALKDQSFFTQSQKGDKVLIFSNARKAVLYRPSINKIIETAPLNNSKDDQTNTKIPEATTGPLKDKKF
ncbi:MAG: hypothetical protein AAB477_01540 [Patescibacteria group bacterium]